jgi:hypothetical protein
MKVFISYSHADERAVERLKTHTAMLAREGLITSFYDRDILAGGHLDSQIFAELESADIFLAMVSPDFLASNYCYEREMERAIELHGDGKIRIVPVLVEECDWKSSPLAQFKSLPKDAKAISTWANENAAYLSVITGLREVAQKNSKPKPTTKSAADATPPSTNSPKAKPAYRVKRSFDQIDRLKFREEAFATIRSFFQSSASEIGAVDGVKALFRPIGDYSFTCTVINEAFGRGVAHITVHMSTDRDGMGDVYWSNQENAERGTSNGSWSIGHTEYDQHLEGGNYSNFGSKERGQTPKAAAEVMWNDFIERAGISHA